MKPPKNFYNNLDRRKQGLPEVPEASAADAGKVIKVGSCGDYELASDAGASVMIVTLANDFTANKTYNEILAALNNGDIVKLVDWTGRNYIYSGMTSGRICFAYLNGYSNTNESDVFTVAVDDTNAWELFLDTITHLPTVTSADAGKVLGVDSQGEWGLDNIQVVVNMNVPAEGNASFVDKTIDEIITLFNKGIPMIFKHNNNIYFLRSIDTTNKTLTLENYTVTAIRLYIQSISFSSQGVGTILSTGINIS